MSSRRLLGVVLTLAIALAACGGKTNDENVSEVPSPGSPPGAPTSPAPTNPSVPPAPMEPAAFYTPAGSTPEEYCPQQTPVFEAATKLKPTGTTAQLVVAEIKYADECTGAGGQYILARDLYAPHEKHFLGRHACLAWKTPPNFAWGVLQYHPTSSQQTISKDVCVAFDDANVPNGVVTASIVRGVDLFATRAEAEQFARSIGWQRP